MYLRDLFYASYYLNIYLKAKFTRMSTKGTREVLITNSYTETISLPLKASHL